MAQLSAIRRITLSIGIACAMTATLRAASPAGQLEELDEVLVTASSRIRLEDFVEFPRYDSVAISPNGTRLAMGWTNDNFQRQIAIIDFPSMKPVHTHALQTFLGVSDVRWVNERRLLVQPDWPLMGFRRIRESLGVIMVSDSNGANLHVINTEPLGTMDPLGMYRRDELAIASAALKDDPASAGRADRNAQGPVRMVAARIGADDQSLFQTLRTHDRRGNTDGHGAFQLDLKDNSQTRVATLPFAGAQLITGAEFRIALASGVNAQNEQVVYYLPPAIRASGSDWLQVARSQSGQRGVRPVAWTGVGEEYYALDGRNAQTRGVVIWNPETGTQRLLHRHPTVDMEEFALDPAGKPWVFSGNDNFPVYWYPDAAHPLAQLHRALVKKVPGEHVDIMNASDDMTTAVVRISSGRRPAVFLVVDVQSASSLTGLFTYPTLRGTRLAPVDPIEFRSRDGLAIRGYLTTPDDARGKPRTGLPLVVIAHDGPLGPGAEYRYEFERQLFASRGYAVLQVNHRGSPGRGASFERAGDGKWGREVQDDYVDGVRWAIRDGVADAGRICFYGTGYGAFSATTAAIREPEMFKCVIGVGGVYDLPRMLGDGDAPIPAALQQVLGSDMDDLKERSPITRAGELKPAILLMPQQKDEYIPTEQSNRMRSALRAAKITVQWEMIGQEYDGYHAPATRAGAYTRILRFLEKQIGE